MSKPADQNLAREGWLDIVKPVDMAGRLDHIPAQKPVTKKQYDTAKKQSYWLSRRSYGMPDGYSQIDWSKKRCLSSK
jgi:hypothetical protein